MSKQILSNIDTKLTLEYIINTKESVIFERKGVFKPNGDIGFTPSKVADVIIGMLNAEGGVLVLGINNGVVEDLNSLGNVKLNDYKQIVHDMVTPPCFIQIEEVHIDGKLILFYHVESDKERVFARKDNEKVFFRNGDETKELDRDWVRKLEYDKSIRKFEDEKREDFEEVDFRKSVLDFYKKKINFEGDYNDLLVYRNLAVKEKGKYIYKNSAILLFAENPENSIPSASVRYIRYDGNKQTTGTNLNVVKDERFEGCLPRIIELVKRFLNNVFRDYYYLDLESGKFVKIPEYPEDAWLEGIVNALTHRSYNLQGNVIYIKHFDDRLEISNSGPLPSIVTVENIKETRFSRNPRIARVLSEMGYVRELNEGVNRIYDSMKKSLLSEPEYIDKNDMVTLILKNNISKNDDTISEKTMKEVEKVFITLNDSQKQILNYLIVNKKATLSDFKNKLGISEQMIRDYLKRFSNIIEKDTDKIRDKNAVYKLKK
ncbi:putative DNA binding domain-containing protein [Candidatus Gracilibacteria bacterium]|nr:putative DNA binding domain-containing protein [Candidatus Gracilibacteria bacterium]